VTYPTEPERLARIPEPASSKAVDRKHNLKSIGLTDPCAAAIRNRQARLILENTLAAARESIRLATEVVIRRGDATRDSFLRHHYFVVARELAAIEGVLEASLWSNESGPPCFVRTLASEISKLECFFAGRIAPVDRRLAIPNFSPSWMAEIIFRLIARAIIYDAFLSVPYNAKISIRLWRDSEKLCFSVEGIGYCSERALLSRIARPKHFRSLLDALSGTFVGAPNGITIHIPVATCAEVDSTDGVAPF
jgi:hypothetical protein